VNFKESALVPAYLLGDIATFIYLVVTNSYSWWNWIVLIPIDFFLASIWPIYWVVLVPMFGLPGAETAARLFGAVLFGALCGLAPYFLAKKKQRQTLAAVALYACIASGLIAGLLLAVPAALVFLLVAGLAKSPPVDIPEPTSAQQNGQRDAPP